MNILERLGIQRSKKESDNNPDLSLIIENHLYINTRQLPAESTVDPNFVVSPGLIRITVETPNSLFVIHPQQNSETWGIMGSEVITPTQNVAKTLKPRYPNKKIVQFWVSSTGVADDLNQTLISHSAIGLEATEPGLDSMIDLMHAYELSHEPQINQHLMSLISGNQQLNSKHL